MPVISNSFHKMIRDMRKLAGLSQKELAELAGVGKTLVFNLEKGKQNASFENVLKVLKILNIKINYELPLQLPLKKKSQS